MKEIVPLAKARDDAIFGSKAVGLGEAARGGLPLPPGVALSGSIVEAVASGEERAIKKVARAVRPLGGPLAVRSSAVDEDGAEASFAGQHLTLLGVTSSEAVSDAVRRDLVVGELGLGDHLPAALEPLRPPERRGGGAGASGSRGRGGDVHAESDQRGGRAGDRGELGARRGGRGGARDSRPLPRRPLG